MHDRMHEWISGADRLIDDMNRNAVMTSVRERVVSLMRDAYQAGLTDSTNLQEKRRLVTMLVQGGSSLETARVTLDEILETVK